MCGVVQNYRDGLLFSVQRRLLRTGLFLCVFLCAVFILPASKAFACPNCGCVAAAHNATRALIRGEHALTRNHIATQFENHRTWWKQVYFRRYVGLAMALMTEQLSAVAMQQMEIIGAFLDAKHQLETQALFQELTARAHKDYYPSVEMCIVGTVARSLAASERRGEFNAVLLSQRLQDRQLMNRNSLAVDSTESDKKSRMKKFIGTYCDPHDNNDGLGVLCGGGGPVDRINKDIDYTYTIGRPLTLDVAFDDNTNPTDDEEDVLALASNLYAHDTFRPISPGHLAEENGQGQLTYLDVRAVIAKRSVAENSFNAIVGMKSRSAIDPAANPYDYMAVIMDELGVTDPADVTTILGENPSYYAQMEFLTKKIYQRPEFYTNLYDKPVNVDRKATAMRAISLMQNMDMFDSRLRSEAMLSVLLELKIMKIQEDVQNRILRMRGVDQPKP